MVPRPALQLVLFDLPIAPLYGGTAEVDFKIRALLDQGLELHIHAWVSPALDRQLRSGAVALPDWSQRVATLQWYPRPSALKSWFTTQPHAVASRSGAVMVEALSRGAKDVLLEGWQVSACMKSPALRNHRFWVRAHNRESQYYQLQANSSESLLKKLYYNIEAFRWLRLERFMAKDANFRELKGVLSLCPLETLQYRKEGLEASYLSAFVRLDYAAPGTDTAMKPLDHPFVLYHGRLDIPDNQRAVRTMLQWAVLCPEFTWVVAGSKASPGMIRQLRSVPGFQWVDTPDDSTLATLVQNASVHVIPSKGRAGLRLKMIHALMGKGHVLVPLEAVEGLPWADWVTTIDHEEDWFKALRLALEAPPERAQLERRHQEIRAHFDPKHNAAMLSDLIFGTDLKKGISGLG